MDKNTQISPSVSKNELFKMSVELERFLNVLGEDLDHVILNEDDPNGLFIREQINSMAFQLEDILSDANYLKRKITDEGNLYVNSAGRYEINEYCYLTSGNVCELLIKDRDGVSCWLKTSIEHGGEHGYYAVKLGRDISIDGIRARVRRG